MVTWKRDGEYVNLDQRIHISEESGNLIIQRLFKEDEGHYQCIVSNMAGSREFSMAKLHVRRKCYSQALIICLTFHKMPKSGKNLPKWQKVVKMFAIYNKDVFKTCMGR